MRIAIAFGVEEVPGLANLAGYRRQLIAQSPTNRRGALIVRHDPNVAASCLRRLAMRDGRLEPYERIPDRLSVVGA